MAFQVQQNPSVERTKRKVEITHKLDEKRKEGAEIAEELIKADAKDVDDDVSRAIPVPAQAAISGSESGEESQQTESEEDTVDEAPSIVDEAMSKEGTSQSSAVITVSVEIEAVKDGLAKVDEAEEPAEEAERIEVKKQLEDRRKKIASTYSGRKLSPFKALGLLGLFFRRTSNAVNLEQKMAESSSTSEESEEEGLLDKYSNNIDLN